jgi:hypothetical protein
MIRLRPIQQQHCSLSRWTFTAKRACVVITDYEPERLAPLPRQRRLASAGFARWRRDVAPTRLRGVWHVKEHTCALQQAARWLQSPIEGGPQGGGPSPQAGSFETGAGADTAASAERRGPPIPRRRHASGTSASRPQRATGMLSDQRHTILARGCQPRRLPDARQ